MNGSPREGRLAAAFAETARRVRSGKRLFRRGTGRRKWRRSDGFGGPMGRMALPRMSIGRGAGM